MCTASWLRDDAGYAVFFNRDELRTRPPASPPRLWRRRGVRFVAPLDASAGGTWLTVNEAGVTVGLLNLYRSGGAPSAPVDDDRYVSRGLLVTNLADCASTAKVMSRLDADDLSRYRPFTILCLDAEGPPRVVDWDGRALMPRSVDRPPLTSSSLVDREARHERRRILDRYRESGTLDRTRLLDFHRSHAPEKGPLSPCMHRPDAATVSLAGVEVGRREVRMLYGDGPACEAALEPGPILGRRS